MTVAALSRAGEGPAGARSRPCIVLPAACRPASFSTSPQSAAALAESRRVVACRARMRASGWSKPMTLDLTGLAAFGWSNHYHSQLELDELDELRSGARRRRASQPAGGRLARLRRQRSAVLRRRRATRGAATVGDWLLLDAATRIAAPAACAKKPVQAEGRGHRAARPAHRRQHRHAVHRHVVQRRVQRRAAGALPRARARRPA